MSTHPLRRIRIDGSAELLGSFDPVARRLRLDRPGFPLLGRGEFDVPGDLPWALQDIAPEGFLAAWFAQWYPELGLPTDRARWTAIHLLTAITRRGHDLPGDLVVGEESWERYQHRFGSGLPPGPTRALARDAYAAFIDALHGPRHHSSVGGQRPKFTLRLADDAGLLVKMTPPLHTPPGRRWGDLLRMEAHCAAVLRAAGLAAVESTYVELADRGYLEVERFDRLPGGGRRGVYTLYWLGAACYQEIDNPVAVVRSLVDDGHLPPEALSTVRLAHAFSAAVGNTDAHQGNYGIVLDDDGAASLAPLYDITAMALAPRYDELPDATLKPRTPPEDAAVAALLADLVARVKADDGLSPEFVETWLRLVGAG